MSTPQFYSWDDDGSPGRALTGNLQNRLKQILVPCLVTGYGSKQGAGWTLGHEHPNGFSLINADGNVVNFVSNLPAQAPYPAMSANAIHIYAAESLTDTSGAIIDGANLCSGRYRKGTPEESGWPRHELGVNITLVSSLAKLQWTLIADDRTFLISSGSVDSLQWFGAPNQFTLYIGSTISDIELGGAFLALGGDNKIYGNGDTPKNYTLAMGFTAPRSFLTGLGGAGEVSAQPFRSKIGVWVVGGVGGLMPANTNFQAPRLAERDGYAGRLRGVVYDDVLALHGGLAYLKALGLYSASDIGKVVTIGEHRYSYSPGYGGGFVMTDAPLFW